MLSTVSRHEYAARRTSTSTNSTNAKPQLVVVTLSLMRIMRRMPHAPSLPTPELVFIACAMACGPERGSSPRKSSTGACTLPISRVPSLAGPFSSFRRSLGAALWEKSILTRRPFGGCGWPASSAR